MLETLAGRLKWEQTEQGIRLVIPARFNGKRILYRLMSELWVPMIIYAVSWYFLSSEARWGIFLGLAFGTVIAIFRLMLTGRAVLLLEPSRLTIEFRSFWIKRSTSKYLTARLENLRFVDASSREEIRNEYRQSEMQIDEDLKTHPFAEGITESEALALIGKMMEVYSFPK
jgi:hypothetical protein